VLAPSVAALLSLAALPSLLSLPALTSRPTLPTLPFLAALPSLRSLPGLPGLASLPSLPGLANLPDLPSVRALLDVARTTSQVATHPGRLRAYLHDAVAAMASALPDAIHREGIFPDAIHQVADAVGIASSILSNARLGSLASSLASTLAGAVATGAGTGTDGSTTGATTGKRRLAILHLDVGEIRQVRKRHGGTDNDVLLAVITGALRHWLSPRAERGSIRALVPVSRRSRPDEPGRGNVLSGYLCDLPVQENDPLTRLRKIRASMDRNKAGGFGHGPGAIPILADRVPAALHRVTAPLTRHGANLLFDTMVTNVPLPARPMSLDGAPLLAVYPIGPLAHGQAFGVALSAYQGRVHVGLHVDQQAVPNLDRLAAAVPTALATLTAAGG
jgi:WS/DGAT/MGAT family acyltransferase